MKRKPTVISNVSIESIRNIISRNRNVIRETENIVNIMKRFTEITKPTESDFVKANKDRPRLFVCKSVKSVLCVLNDANDITGFVMYNENHEMLYATQLELFGLNTIDDNIKIENCIELSSEWTYKYPAAASKIYYDRTTFIPSKTEFADGEYMFIPDLTDPVTTETFDCTDHVYRDANDDVIGFSSLVAMYKHESPNFNSCITRGTYNNEPVNVMELNIGDMITFVNWTERRRHDVTSALINSVSMTCQQLIEEKYNETNKITARRDTQSA